MTWQNTYIVDDNNTASASFVTNPSGKGGNSIGYWAGNSDTNQNPEFFCNGTGINYGISFRGKGNWFFAFHATPQAAAKVRWYEREQSPNHTKAVGITAPQNLQYTHDYYLPTNLPTINTRPMCVSPTGQMGWSSFLVPKMACVVDGKTGETATLLNGFNVQSVSRPKLGQVRINFIEGVGANAGMHITSTQPQNLMVDSKNSFCIIETRNGSGTPTDSYFTLVTLYGA